MLPMMKLYWFKAFNLKFRTLEKHLLKSLGWFTEIWPFVAPRSTDSGRCLDLSASWPFGDDFPCKNHHIIIVSSQMGEMAVKIWGLFNSIHLCQRVPNLSRTLWGNSQGLRIRGWHAQKGMVVISNKRHQRHVTYQTTWAPDTVLTPLCPSSISLTIMRLKRNALPESFKSATCGYWNLSYFASLSSVAANTSPRYVTIGCPKVVGGFDLRCIPILYFSRSSPFQLSFLGLLYVAIVLIRMYLYIYTYTYIYNIYIYIHTYIQYHTIICRNVLIWCRFVIILQKYLISVRLWSDVTPLGVPAKHQHQRPFRCLPLLGMPLGETSGWPMVAHGYLWLPSSISNRFTYR